MCFILAMMNCVYCTSDIAEVDKHCVVSNLGPEIVSVLEQNFLSRLDGGVNDGVLYSQCFNSIIVAMSTVRHSPGHEHNLQNRHNTIECVRCCTSLFGRRAHSLSEGLARDFIAENIAPREIPDGGLLCFSCWQYTQRMLQQQGIIASPQEVECVWCLRSLTQTRRQSVPEGPERDEIMATVPF